VINGGYFQGREVVKAGLKGLFNSLAYVIRHKLAPLNGDIFDSSAGVGMTNYIRK
jgi:hypothetical protein